MLVTIPILLERRYVLAIGLSTSFWFDHTLLVRPKDESVPDVGIGMDGSGPINLLLDA